MVRYGTVFVFDRKDLSIAASSPSPSHFARGHLIGNAWDCSFKECLQVTTSAHLESIGKIYWEITPL
jgi:hypothetical protein